MTNTNNNGDKMTLGELKATVDILCQRVDKLESKIDKIEEKLNTLSGKIVGASVIAATIIGFIINLIR